ncbi:hypothetical protein EZJ49_08695 [Bdellovibrio bacteriovorus]|uniref:hypothetical protein n=1 Tax=Bdellovibrio bacteriovorus TaxID=959 RepID=UPI0021D0BBC9|nr:hypothetical protein [Bdellovibrio bacteriovorus]UXR63153.1 hypothetical protein EZJ49_08695 [Bdellovibrio bacteriovorus]
MQLNSLVDGSLDEILSEDFKVIATDICRMLATEGKVIVPYLPGLPYFSQLPSEGKKRVVETLRFYQDLCHSQLAEGYRINDSLSFTWRAFRRLGLVPRAELFNHIRNEDIVEIYSEDHIQLFRNFTFFDFCSYTLEELHTNEWWALFERDEEITTKIIEEVRKVFSEEIRETFTPNIPKHVLREIRSADRLCQSMEIRRMSPLYRNKKVAAVIVLEKVEMLQN